MANLVINGKSIDSLEEIAENFFDEDVVKAFDSGILVDWLDEFGYDDEVMKIRAIETSDNIVNEIVIALGLDMEEVELSRRKILNERAAEKEKALEAARRVALLEEASKEVPKEDVSAAQNELELCEPEREKEELELRGDLPKGNDFVLDGYVIDPSKCLCCGACQVCCPAEAIEKDGSAYVINVDKCEVCGCCEDACTVGAICLRYDRLPPEGVSSVEESVVYDEPWQRIEVYYDETWQRIENIIVEQLGVEREQITPNSSIIDDLGADSLDTMELVMALEEEFGPAIPEEDAEMLLTPGDAYRYLKHKGY